MELNKQIGGNKNKEKDIRAMFSMSYLIKNKTTKTGYNWLNIYVSLTGNR